VRAQLGIENVKLQNDADACALAEWRFGAGRGTRNMVFLTFGTGLGAGLILDGRLYTGASGLAGEVGHIRLAPDGPEGYRKRGSFEGFCSGGGIARLIKMRTGWDCDARALAQKADAGDPQALAVWEEIGARFGHGLAVLVDILNPEAVVAGSIFARAYRFLYEPAMRALKEEALPESLAGLRLLPAELGEQIGDYAAVAIGCE
jgi:glucokinase